LVFRVFIKSYLHDKYNNLLTNHNSINTRLDVFIQKKIQEHNQLLVNAELGGGEGDPLYRDGNMLMAIYFDRPFPTLDRDSDTATATLYDFSFSSQCYGKYFILFSYCQKHATPAQ